MSEQFQDGKEISHAQKAAFEQRVIEKAPVAYAVVAEPHFYKVQYEKDNIMVLLTVPAEASQYDSIEVAVYEDEDAGALDGFIVIRKKRYVSYVTNDIVEYSEQLEVYDDATGRKLSDGAINFTGEQGMDAYTKQLDDERNLGLRTFTNEQYKEVMALLDALSIEHIVQE